MNFFHLNVGHISRSTGRSTVQNVAYITGEILHEERRNLPADYENNRGKTTWGTLAPLGSGIVEDDLSFWNKLENFEDAYAKKRFKNPATLEEYLSHARVGQTYEVSLPKELTEEQNIALAREIAFERFVSRGLLATYAINRNEGNPHAHITVSTRTVWNGEISWDKSVARALVTPSGLRESRKIFAQTINKHQELAGLSDRVDWRSNADRGIDLIPGYHKGWQAHQLEKGGLPSRIVAENAQISEENKERIAQFPEIILRELTSKQATFSQRDVVKLVQDRMKDDIGVLSQHVIYSVMKESVEVGVGFDDLKRYTSKDYKAKEDHILGSLEAYKDQTAAISISQERIDTLLGGEASWLNSGQKEAVNTLCGEGQFSILIGRAGTGKTTALRYAVQLHQEAGYKVLGMAPSATAAYELRKGAGCPSDTIAHYAYHWKPYFEAVEKLGKATTEQERALCLKMVEAHKKDLPDQNTLILVDEIGMVGVGNAFAPSSPATSELGTGAPGTSTLGTNAFGAGVPGTNAFVAGGWDVLIKTVNATGAKFTVVGDDHQAKPIEAGDVSRKVFRDFKDTQTLCTLTEIQRQTIPWMKEASSCLAELKTSTALEMYEKNGHIQEHETNEYVYQDMAHQYLRNLVSQPDSQTLVMAYTNQEVLELNGAIRTVLKENGFLAKEDVLTRKRRVAKSFEGLGEGKISAGKNPGTKGQEGYIQEGYVIGDKIIFTQNDRGFWTKFDSDDPSFFVRNGMQGRIESLTACSIKGRGTDKVYNTYKICVRVEDAEEKGKGEGKEHQSPSRVSFYLHEYSHFQHGYAVTVHKTQGATGGKSLVKFSRYMDAYTLYVAMTRHQQDVNAYYAKEDFATFSDLLKSLGKVPNKDLAADYSILEEHKDFWLNVQEYKALGFDILFTCSFAKSFDQATDKATRTDEEKEQVSKAWETVAELTKERKQLAGFILGSWDTHGEFARQAGLTVEMLEIGAGTKERPLSRREWQAHLLIEQYTTVAMETRQAWHAIRRTHGKRIADTRIAGMHARGTSAKTHPEWITFEALRDQRGFLATQIMQNPVLYRPFLKNAAKAFENDGQGSRGNKQGKQDKRGKSHFGYGLSIIKAQSEAYQSKMLQQEILKNTSDPVLSEKLKTLLGYRETSDLSASAWKELKPKLKQVEGTLLSEGFCKEIADWVEIRGARDQLALKIVDSWEEYTPLMQKVGLKLSFETLINQKDQAVRDTLFKTYLTNQEESAKLQAAFDLKVLMDEERETGKKITVSETYRHGLQPKDIAKHAGDYQKLKAFESLSTDTDRQTFLLLDEYDDKCREANRIYGMCLKDIQETVNTAHEKGKEPKPWDSPFWPSYQEACKPRNRLALEIFEQSDHGKILALADLMGLKLKEVDHALILSRGEDGYRAKMLDHYKELSLSPDAKSEVLKAKLAGHLVKMIQDDQEEGHKKTLLAIYKTGVKADDVFATANEWKEFTLFKTLDTQEEQEIFGLLFGYKAQSERANGIYRRCAEESKVDPHREKPGIKVSNNPLYPEYLKAVSGRNRYATALLESPDWEHCFSLADQWGISIDEEKLFTQSSASHRETLLERYLGESSLLVKRLIARELKGMMDEEQKEGIKTTAADLYRNKILPEDIQDEAKQFDRMAAYANLKDDVGKRIFSLLEQYNGLVTRSNKHYGTCFQEAEAQGVKKEETASYALFQNTLTKRQKIAMAIQHMARPHVIEGMAEEMGVPLKTLHKDRHHYELKQGQEEFLGEKNHEKQNQFQSQPQYQDREMKLAKEIEKTEETEKPIPSFSQDAPPPLSSQNPLGDRIDLAAKGFVSLSEKYGQTHWKDPEREKIRESLDKIVSTHWQDDRFTSKVENSGSKIAAGSIKIEIHLMETELSQHRHQGSPAQEGKANLMDTGLVPPTLAKIELAAKEFVSLSEKYEQTHWKDAERSKIREFLDKIISTHWRDDRFTSTIESSGSKIAADSIKIEIHLMETHLSQSRRELDR